jgi:electron transfer flavoprotein-quinone oxidoreductase
MAEVFDAVVVGAGPAGSAAALVLARAGKAVCLLERGPFPGSKNLYGGVIYPRVLDGLLPRWRDELPVERWVTRRTTMALTRSQALSVDLRTTAWGSAPYNGATALRPKLDAWLAAEAEAAGASLVCSTTATGLITDEDGGAVRGVRVDRPDGDIEARVVIACDGVNALLAREAGCAGKPDPGNFTLGVKEVLALDRAEIDKRFALSPGEGADLEIIGCTGGVPGGGFLYTNRDSVAIGLVLRLPELAASGRRPEEILADLKAHPAVRPLVGGGDLVEYGAHLIPEAGWDMMPKLATAGMMVAGDAAAMCLATGLWLEGVNFAIGSGAAAGEAAVEALSTGDTSEAGLAGYRRRLEASFVLADHKRFRRAHHLVLSDRVQHTYPEFVCNLVEQVFTVDNAEGKPGLLRLARRQARRSGLRLRHLARDAAEGLRSFG